jgi:anaerobic magnesium-protoporphyrin IX monomethyl ester cyclase
MRVLLLRPNSPMVVAPVPLGLGYLSHALKTARQDEVRIIDGRRFRLPPPRIVEEAAAFRPDVIGVTSMTFEAPEAIDLIARFKQKWPDTAVVLGGPHATACGPDLLAACPADYLVMGEGEQTLVELLDALEGKRGLEGIPGLARRRDGKITSGDCRDPVLDMDRIAVDWDAMQPARYFSSFRRNALNTIARSPRRLPVFFSRGCPFGCSYCHHIFGRKYRPFPIERAVAEMIMLRDRYRLREFEIIDDTFNLDLAHAKEVMREIIARKLNASLTFTSGLRADRMDEELLDLMARAGTYRIDYAIECASPRIQKQIHKNLDLGRAREVVNMTARRRIVTGTYNILGFPGETEEEMEQTVEYALSLENHIASFFYLMPFPGTEISEADPEISKKVRELTFRDASAIALNLSAVPDEVLRKIKRRAYRGFYFSAPRIYRIGRDVPKNLRLLASAIAALRLSFQENVNY